MVDFDTTSLSPENQVPAKVLQYRAQVALGQAKEAHKAVSKEGDGPDYAAVKCFTQYFAGQDSEAIKGIERLAATHSDNSSVQVLGGILLQAAEKTEEALTLLSKHEGSLEA